MNDIIRISKSDFFAILTAYLDANVESCLNHVMFTLLLLCKKWRVSGHVALIYLTKYVFAEWEMFSNIAYTPSIPWRRQSQPKWILFNFLISQFLACIRLILIKLLWHFSVCWWISIIRLCSHSRGTRRNLSTTVMMQIIARDVKMRSN